jgi:hypothetical protein
MPDQFITHDQVKKAMQCVMEDRNQLAQSRRELTVMLANAKRQGLFVKRVSSGCETDCPTIHAGAE